MFGKVVDVLFVLVLGFLVIKNADAIATVISATAGGTGRLVQILQGNVAAGQGT